MQLSEIVSMVSSEYRVGGRQRASLAARERDAALVRVSRARRWMIGAAAALSAGITALVSSVAPGHTLKKGAQSRELTATRSTAPARTAARMPPLASPSDLGLQGPSSAPAAASGPSQSAPDPTQSAAPDNSQAAAGSAPAPAPAPTPAPAPAVSGGS
jgi:peptidoglycan DL-endopeptidase CwlO